MKTDRDLASLSRTLPEFELLVPSVNVSRRLLNPVDRGHSRSCRVNSTARSANMMTTPRCHISTYLHIYTIYKFLQFVCLFVCSGSQLLTPTANTHSMTTQPRQTALQDHVINWSCSLVTDRKPCQSTREINEVIHIRIPHGRITIHEPQGDQLSTQPCIQPFSWCHRILDSNALFFMDFKILIKTR